MKRKNVNILAALLHVVDTSNHLFDVGLNFLTQPFFYIYFYYFIFFCFNFTLYQKVGRSTVRTVVIRFWADAMRHGLLQK